MSTIKTGVFGEICGEEGKDYFVVETNKDGSKLCRTSLFQNGKPDPKVCSEKLYSNSSSYSGRPCSNKATTTVEVIRNVQTSGSRYGVTIEEFTVDAKGFLIGEVKALKETVKIGYCKIHDPATIEARRVKKDAERTAEYQKRNERDAQEREYKLIADARLCNYRFVEKAVAELMGACADTSNLTKAQKEALNRLALQMAQVPEFVSAGRKHYGISSYMIGDDGRVKAEYRK